MSMANHSHYLSAATPSPPLLRKEIILTIRIRDVPNMPLTEESSVTTS